MPEIVWIHPPPGKHIALYPGRSLAVTGPCWRADHRLMAKLWQQMLHLNWKTFTDLGQNPIDMETSNPLLKRESSNYWSLGLH